MGVYFIADGFPVIRWNHVEKRGMGKKFFFGKTGNGAESLICKDDFGKIQKHDTLPNLADGFEEYVVQESFKLIRDVQAEPLKG